MTSVLRPKLSKIPGVAPALKQENVVKDLTKLSRLELLDLRARQEKLLANKANLHRLPDKGERIKILHEKVVAEMERRTNVDEAAKMFSKLNIAATGQEALNNMEWCGHLGAIDSCADPTQDVLDSDDESELDPLRVLAQRTMHKKHTKVLPPEPKLITTEDLLEIASFKSDSLDSVLSAEEINDSHSKERVEVATTETVDVEIVTIDVDQKLPKIKSKLQNIGKLHPSLQPSIAASDDNSCNSTSQEVEQHVRYLVEKTELHSTVQREKFKPYKTTLTDVHAPEKECLHKRGKYWEVTAATPPPIQHTAAKLVPLLDSIEIQAHYLAKMKELQVKQAEERLAARLERMENRKLQIPSGALLKANSSFTEYRQPANHIEGDRKFNEDEEVYDPSDLEGPGAAVTYSVYN